MEHKTILYIMKSQNTNGSPHFSHFAAADLRRLLHDKYNAILIIYDLVNDVPLNTISKQYDIVIYQDVGGECFTDIHKHNDCINIMYALDSHGKLDYLKRYVDDYHYVFSAIKDTHPDMGKYTWLPVAVSIDQHYPKHSPLIYDVAFIGRCGNRTPRWWMLQQLADICQRKKLKFYISEHWGKDYLDVVSRTKVMFNFNVSNDINFRNFESMAMGKCLLTDEQDNGMEDLFNPYEDYIPYIPQFLEKNLLFAIDNHETVAGTGYNSVVNNHTWYHRFDKMLQTIGLEQKVSGV